ncbi:glycosyltransferase [Streptococcus orisasini]|uniref:glycosyltransferase n=1 Tax=Streptococcus orisasini TaxID=1080071 RepID=UPI00070F4990|nr:glycosyltransferase [Streptococcus orisasini]
MYKILMTGMSPVLAGTETFIMNYYRHLNPQKIQIDFIKRTKEPIIFEEEILARGSKVYYLPRKGKTISAYQNYKRALTSFFDKHAKDYDAVWYNAMGIPNIDLLVYAQKYGIKERIIHSHSSQWKGNFARLVFHTINKKRIKKIATRFFACSDLAARYMYTGSALEKSRIIQNAIEFKNFAFSASARENLRKSLGWQQNKIIGNVGRLDIQKNQPFLIDVFNKALELDDSLRLVIIGKTSGTNSTEELIKQKIKDYDIADKVLMAGSQSDMKTWLSALDLFVLPSLFEGLPLSAVEAQANGLPVLASDTITKELKILDSLNYLSLDEEPAVWAQTMIDMLKLDRSNTVQIKPLFEEKGFDISSQAKDIESLLLGEEVE